MNITGLKPDCYRFVAALKKEFCQTPTDCVGGVDRMAGITLMRA
jgi:hypothetical protein